MILGIPLLLQNAKALANLGYIVNNNCYSMPVASNNGVHILGFSNRHVFNIRVSSASVKMVNLKQAAEFILLLDLGLSNEQAMEAI